MAGEWSVLPLLSFSLARSLSLSVLSLSRRPASPIARSFSSILLLLPLHFGLFYQHVLCIDCVIYSLQNPPDPLTDMLLPVGFATIAFLTGYFDGICSFHCRLSTKNNRIFRSADIHSTGFAWSDDAGLGFSSHNHNHSSLADLELESESVHGIDMAAGNVVSAVAAAAAGTKFSYASSSPPPSRRTSHVDGPAAGASVSASLSSSTSHQQHHQQHQQQQQRHQSRRSGGAALPFKSTRSSRRRRHQRRLRLSRAQHGLQVCACVCLID